MRTSRVLVFLSLLVMSAAVNAALLDTAPEPAQSGTTTEQVIAGRNVNMVSGTKLPGGDPWLQRQNEPSVAVSTRNPLHLLAGANDYRTVDVPFSEGELPGLSAANAGDAWLGVFKSFDGGESWTTSLIPGFPQDLSAEGMASPLKEFSTAADPMVRAGTNGLFYYSGMAFNRDQTKGGGSLFLARFIDNNDVEGGDPIKYLDVRMIDAGTSGQFIDMPRIAVDMPRGTGTVSIDGQTIPRSNVYAAYTVFLGNADVNIRSRIMFRRSTDCGATWGSAVKITESQHIIQGATIAIDPNSGAVYVAYRRFLHPSQTNSMVIVKSTDFGQSFTKPAVIADIQPFDQPTTDDLTGPPFGTSFRTNSYPTMTVDDNGIVYVAWAERGWGPGGLASRIVLYTSQGGTSWTGPLRVDDHAYAGHQFMPYLTYASGKLTLAWYDQRDSASVHGYGMDHWVSDCNEIRQTIDIRAAQADPGLFPVFPPSLQVSRYLWAIFDDGSIEQVQYNPPNYPLFKGGTAPFTGDYIEVTPSPMFVRNSDGAWRFNTSPSTAPVFHIVWADNRDVRPPEDGVSWDKYTPPASDQGVFGSQDCGSVDIPHMGMRNQNIYTSALTRGMVAAAPANAKPLGDGLGCYYETNDLVQRAFVIYVKNPTDLTKDFRLSIVTPPASGTASFLEFESLSSLDVTIAAFSLIARTVFVRSTDPYDTVTVRVAEIDPAGYEVQGGLTGEVVLNPDPTNPQISSDTDEIHNPNIRNSEIVNWSEVESPNIRNENYLNPNIRNPNIVNPNIVNPNIRNENVVNPTVVNPNIRNPNIRNASIVNPNIVNPNIRNESLQDPDVYDVTATVVNDGNTITSYTLKTFSKETVPDGLYLQLLAYKVYYTAAADEDGTSADSCLLKTERHHELLLNVVNPNIRNPNIVNPNIRNPNIRNESVENATFALAPGEEADVVVRIIKPDASGTLTILTDMGTYEAFNIKKFAESIGIAATSQAVNTKEAREDGVFVPPAAASKLIIGTSSLPDGVVGTFYSTTLVAYGGNEPYYWSFTSGELPPGLVLGSGGTINGTPLAAGVYYFIVRVDDSAGDFDTQRYSIYIDDDGIADPLTITTTSLPSGVLDSWYGATLEAKGGVWPRTWSLHSGSLPLGLELDSDGVISGTIRQEEGQDYPTSYSFSVLVAARTGATSAPQALSIAVNINTGVYFTISGTAYDEVGSPLDGVVMRGLPNTPVTSADGYYQDSVPENWSGSVIPFKSGHTFTPESRTYTQVSSDQLGQDYGYVPTPVFPDIHIRESTTDIPDGGSYDFGPHPVGSETDVVFTIENFGAADLVITTPITIGGPNADQWSVLVQPTSPVHPGDSTTFTIRFSPLSEGEKVAAIAIGNNDPDENPYDILLAGTASLPVTAWAKTYGGTANDHAYSVQQTLDGGYIVGGISTSYGAGSDDIWALKLDSAGEVTWQKTYGGSGSDYAYSVQQTSDGGYIVGGWTNSFGAGSDDIWVLKLDAVGEVTWQKTYGGSGIDRAYSIQQTPDGGYIVGGYTNSFGAGGDDIWVLKLDAVGEVTWQKTYGGSGIDRAYSIQQIPDGGYIVGGQTSSYGAGGRDLWVLKLDAVGEVTWQKTYGGSSTDSALSVQQTSDGGYIVGGWTNSFGAIGTDFWVLKLDGQGEVTWHKTYGGPADEAAFSVQQTPDGSYIVGGWTSSYGVLYNCWVLKLDSTGEVAWQKTYGGSERDSGYSVQQTSDGGYIVGGATSSFGAGIHNLWVLKLGPDGSIDASCSPGIGADSSAIPASPSVTPSTSTATAADSTATITDTTVAPADTSAVVQTQCQIGQVLISGTITVGDSGLAGVVMSGLHGEPVTDANGYYGASASYGWSGTVTPTLAGYSFNPANRSYSGVSSNLDGQDYVATFLGGGVYFTVQPSDAQAGQPISPNVRVKILGDDGAPLPGISVTVSIENNAGGGTLSGGTSTVTNSAGEATFMNLSINAPGSGYTLRVAAALTGYGWSNYAISIPFNIL